MKLFNRKDNVVRYFLTGFAMGSADIVPGVSGGTIAFIAGIYEKLIESIKIITGDALKKFFKGDIAGSIKAVPFTFLVPLGLGILAAIFTLAQFLEVALSDYPVYIWSFFFGLIVASIFLVRKRVKNWNFQLYAVLGIAALGAFMLVAAVPVQTPATPLAFFLSGAIAISAMILPGISGSFLLLIMGKYEQILTAVTEFDIVTLGIFMAGAVVGLALFSRLLSWLFKNYHDVMIAALTGLMLGSLRKIWPWKETLETYVDSHGEVVPLVQANVMPPAFNVEFVVALILGAVGFLVIQQVEKHGAQNLKDA